MRRPIVIGCGGGGCNAVSLMRGWGVAVATVNTGSSGAGATVALADGGVSGCRGDSGLGWALASDSADDIEALMDGYQAVIAVAGLGGGTGAGAIPVIAERARRRGMKVVSVVSIPLAFESRRRVRALAQLRETVRKSDRTIVADIERVKDAGGAAMPMRDSVSMANEIMAEAVIRCARLMDGPFFSTFCEKAYTVAYARASDPAAAARAAVGYALFDPLLESGRAIASPDGRLSQADRDSVSGVVGGLTGAVPDFAPCMKEGDGMMLFIPISCRSL
ncbi:MAG: hypothetical protein LBG62_02975 [Candidatus Methanoplasma sp.]|jgi:cell division protein FtsZ|nr:hypothetical protein [Candidatus Methanoplasma sp.]